MISIQFDSVAKSYGSTHALKNLSFSVLDGDVYGLLGPNGAGKTTTINILCNLLRADRGNVMVKGSPPSETTRTIIGVAPQETAIYRDLTCVENLRLFGRLYGLTSEQMAGRVSELIDTFGFNEYATSIAHTLSGGWKRRLNIAIAMMHAPSVLILDEPSSGLDVEARYALWEFIERLRQAEVTIVLSTHYLEEAERLCSRIGIITDGRIVAEGSLDELRSRVPAVQLAQVDAENSQQVGAKARSIGWDQRMYGGKLTLFLPRKHSMKEVVDIFEGIPLTSLTLRDVGLEHVYLEVTEKKN